MIYDISVAISDSLVVWPGDPPIKMTQPLHLDRGDICTITRLDFSVHTGTHLDAPAHFIPGGAGVETLDLNALVGPALVVQATDVDSITADLLESLNVPPGTERLLIGTKNSERWAAGEGEFDKRYVAVAADAAHWLVRKGVRVIGVDYLSVAPFADVVSTHQILLGAGIIPVEGLNLHGISPGIYQFVCLPLKIDGCDGAPARAILMD